MDIKEWLGEDNTLGIDIWEKKYRHEEESFDEWLDRVSAGDEKVRQLIVEKKFLFGGRILSNRGVNKKGKKVTLSNCYVITPPEDDIESIFECAAKLARTFSYGGGCGIDISKLAPKGAKVNNTAKETTGSVSFMELYSLVTGLIGQNGRRGALMISISCDHPDLEDFIELKSDLNKVTKANISIRMTDEFMNAVKNDLPYTLRFTRKETGEVITKEIKARDVFRKIAKMNWDMGEPGVLFWDTITKWNMLSDNTNFEFAGVNPCAEETLPSGGSCLLGSLNLSEFVEHPFTNNSFFNINAFSDAVKVSVIALDSVLNEGIPLHPLPEQRKSVSNWRQIGLGIFGLADMFIKLGIKYGSNAACEVCDNIGKIMINEAVRQSSILASENGSYPMFDKDTFTTEYIKKNLREDVFNLVMENGIRHSQMLTIAPTGTLSTMLGVSGGVEPIFANYYTRKTESLHGEDVLYKVYTPIVKKYMDVNKISDDKLLPDYFVVSESIPYEDRIHMQGTWQRYIDASISSTVNLPNTATVEDVENIYIKAWENGLKGITVFRSGCARMGILTTEPKEREDIIPEKSVGLERGAIEPIPEGLIYEKYKITSGCGNLYLFVGVDKKGGRIYDCFTNTDGVGGCVVNTQCNSRLLSAGLRSGISVEYLISQMEKAGTCPSYQYARGKGKKLSPGKSCSSAIAYILKNIKNDLDKNKGRDDGIQTEYEPCPECKKHELTHEGGCVVCRSCGWSRCS